MQFNDFANASRPTLTEQNFSSDFEHFGLFQEFEANASAISGTTDLSWSGGSSVIGVECHGDDLDSLSDGSAMQHCLIFRGDCGGMVEDHDLGREFPTNS